MERQVTKAVTNPNSLEATVDRLSMEYNYPHHPDYFYETKLSRVNLDDARRESLRNNRGFIIAKSQSSLKKNLKDPNGIYSTKFGQTLDDLNPFIDRYKCECGALKSRINNKIKCEACGTRVKYVDDDFGYFGWIVLNEHYVIHPNLFKSLQYLIGSEKLNNIIMIVDDRDIDGFSSADSVKKRTKDEPFYGIGMMEFKERIMEILKFYLAKSPNKLVYYEDIVAHLPMLFTQSIPVYTTHLRPSKPDATYFHFEGTNAPYNMMAKLASYINDNRNIINRKRKPKNHLLYDLQTRYMALYKELEANISGKKGAFRSVFGGRYNFTSRSVIVPNPALNSDQVVMPYSACVELMQQRIINILQRSYTISYSDAYLIWEKSQYVKDDRVYNIIKGIIKEDCDGQGIPILINRNPTIMYGGILQMFIVDITMSYTLGLPLEILKPLAADFDGDVLNIHYIINKEFYRAANMTINPRNAMFVSRNDGKVNAGLIHSKDLIINANTLHDLGKKSYSQAQINKIKMLQNLA